MKTYPEITFDEIVYVVPCGGKKASEATAARDLYVGTMFQHTLRAVETLAANDVASGLAQRTRILILSALHGLIGLDDVVAPYEMKMGAAGSISSAAIAEQAQALGIDWDSNVYAFLPQAYFSRLDDALRSFDCYAHSIYGETAEGIGDQKHINASAYHVFPEVEAA